MRATLRRIETLAPVPFVLLVAIVAGLLRSVGSIAQPRGLAALGLGLLLAAAAGILWWVAVRRRQHSLWSIALQLTIAIALADLIALTIVLPAFVPEMRELAWRDVAVSGVTAQLGLSLIRFPVALALVAAGRHLPGIGPRSAANAAAESSAPSEAAS